jgi:CBS domain-containing protein
VRAESPLDLLTLRAEELRDLLGHLGTLRTTLEQHIAWVDALGRFREAARAHPRLAALRTRDALTGQPRTLPTTATFADAVRLFRAEGVVAAAVVDESGRLVGTCAAADLQAALAALRPPATPLAQLMRSPPVTVPAGSPLAEAALALVRRRAELVVVVADDDPSRPLGVLRPFDVLTHYVSAEPTGPPAAS